MGEQKFNELLKLKAIARLNETEKENYLKFFESTYKDNLSASSDNLNLHPRWSIIAGYYAMHDIAKLFLAKKYNIKIVERVHFATIISLSNFIEENKNEILLALDLLKKAKEIFDVNIIGVKPEDLVYFLKKGRREREKAQYYSSKTDLSKISENAHHFLNDLVNPFIKLFEKLLEK